MRFRPTLWFKKGVLDAEAARCEAEGRAPAAIVDSLPIEDRYLDDGTLEPDDSIDFGVHTGQTQALDRVKSGEGAGIDERLLIGEMKRGRRIYLGLLAAVVIIGAALVLVA